MVGYLKEDIKFGVIKIKKETLVIVDNIYANSIEDTVPVQINTLDLDSEGHDEELSRVFNLNGDIRVNYIVIYINKDLIDFREVHYTDEEIAEIGF